MVNAIQPKTMKNNWRTEFAKAKAANTIDETYFKLKKVGSGMAISQASGTLIITTGTTAYSETIVRSQKPVRDCFKARVFSTLSQRIANQEFHVELVDLVDDGLPFLVTSATSVVVTWPVGENPFSAENVGQSINLQNFSLGACLSGRYAIASVSGDTTTFTVSGFPTTGVLTGTVDLTGRNYHRVLYDGTSATTAKYDTQAEGYNSGDTSVTTNTTASGHEITLINDGQKASVQDGSTGSSSSGNSMSQRGARQRNIPEPTLDLYLQLRAVNLATNPASTTTWTMDYAAIEAYEPLQVSIVDVEPMTKIANMPVEVANGSGVFQNTTTGIMKLEDAAAASGDAGIFALAVRRDTLTSSASGTGDYSEQAVDTYGANLVRDYEKHARTYSAAIVGLVPAASATDIFVIGGHGSSTIFITKLVVSATQTTGGEIDLRVLKRSTAFSGGTASNPTKVPHDSADAAANAVISAFTANPSIGSLVGDMRAQKMAVNAPAAPGKNEAVFEFGDKGRPVILRGLAEALAVNLNAVTVTGGLFDIYVEWFEI